MFTANLAAMNGAAPSHYEFEVAFLGKHSAGKYSELMISQCAKLCMKPVCDHRNYCGSQKDDRSSIFIGQTHHISLPSHRNNLAYFPFGWAAIKDHWIGLCNYAAKVNVGGNALCNLPANTHSWRNPAQTNPGFMCAQIRGRKLRSTFTGKLGSSNGVAAADYLFQVAYLQDYSRGSYADRMVEACAALTPKGMKPVCDHPNYCKTDQKAIYIGQTQHLAYRPHRVKYVSGPRSSKPGEFVVLSLSCSLCWVCLAVALLHWLV